jgi:hypothetical protein
MVIYTITTMGDKQVLTALINGVPKVATSEHPMWNEIVSRVEQQDDTVSVLFDVEHVAASEFKRISERVTIKNGRVLFDGDPFSLDLSQKIVDFVKSGANFEPMVKFLDKFKQNPSLGSQEQAIEWLARYNWGIDEEGNVIGYKGVYRNVDVRTGNVVSYRSVHSGSNEVVVDNVTTTGHVTQSIGSTVEMARGEVVQNPREACSTGLHVSNFDYAKTYGDAILAVSVNPRDFVSVPYDDNFVKVRVCRYFVMAEVTEPVDYAGALPKSNGYQPDVEEYPSPDVVGSDDVYAAPAIVGTDSDEDFYSDDDWDDDYSEYDDWDDEEDATDLATAGYDDLCECDEVCCGAKECTLCHPVK